MPIMVLKMPSDYKTGRLTEQKGESKNGPELELAFAFR